MVEGGHLKRACQDQHRHSREHLQKKMGQICLMYFVFAYFHSKNLLDLFVTVYAQRTKIRKETRENKSKKIHFNSISSPTSLPDYQIFIVYISNFQ